MRIVFVSDLHNKAGKVSWPDGDVLVVAGDSTMMGRPEEIGKFAAYMEALPYFRKVVIAGNHDWLFQTKPKVARQMMEDSGIDYLEDSSVEIKGYKFYGAPWQPWFHDWAFNVERGQDIAEKWALIPDDTDVLITHGPPHGILDLTMSGEHVGCEELRNVLIERVRPSYHAFGHIHHSYGWRCETALGVEFINASICNERYEPTNAPIVRYL